MITLPADATDAQILAAVDQWAGRLEAEDYAGASALTEHPVRAPWTPVLLQQVIDGYGWHPKPGQRVTVAGVPGDVAQRQAVERWAAGESSDYHCVGDIWYDLYIDGVASDLTATFDIMRVDGGLRLRLIDIHVM